MAGPVSGRDRLGVKLHKAFGCPRSVLLLQEGKGVFFGCFGARSRIHKRKMIGAVVILRHSRTSLRTLPQCVPDTACQGAAAFVADSASKPADATTTGDVVAGGPEMRDMAELTRAVAARASSSALRG